VLSLLVRAIAPGALLLCARAFAAEAGDGGGSGAGATYEVRRIEGWTVHVREDLLRDQKPAVEAALVLVQQQLHEVVRLVPGAALAHLRGVNLWISPEYTGVRPTVEYHPDVAWLRDHGRDPAMAKGVEFTNLRILAREVKRMPVLVLHELAHAYHDQVFGFGNAEIKAAYKRAKESKGYDKVERWHGDGRPNTFERAYAMTTPQEYFAETSEAFFGRNDFFPFTNDELKKHDPEMFKLLERLWNSPVQGAKVK
jgi:hypothetical protein